jgi:hypothetical protein
VLTNQRQFRIVYDAREKIIDPAPLKVKELLVEGDDHFAVDEAKIEEEGHIDGT